MSIIINRISLGIMSSLGLFAALTGATPSQAAVNPNDGRWSVQVLTEKGDCDQAYRYAVIIENGKARYGGTEPVVVSGQVAMNGSLSGAISYGENRANVVGKLTDGWGQGSWTFSGSRTCSGSWNAERRG